MKIYQVGGAVRDKLSGRTPHDIDYVVTGATSAMMKAAGFKEVGRGFPVFLHPLTGEEYALARKEIKTGAKHTDFEFIFNENISLREDLERRDFTCNAIAYDESSGQYIDYFNGRQDIENKVLRHVNAQHFVEDPLRVLRLCRFAAQLDFNAASETLELCRKMTDEGMLEHLTAERIWNEMYKALQSDAFYRFIESAGQVGALKVILPEVEALCSEEGKPANKYIISALRKAANKSALVNFTVMMLGICKIQIPLDVFSFPQEYEKHARDLIYKICRRLKIPNRFRAFAAMAAVQYLKFPDIRQMCPDKLYDLADAMTLGHVCCVEEYIEVCHTDFLVKSRVTDYALFAQNADKLRHACRILISIKADEMPDFARLPKDENFKWHLREYKIKKLCQQLDF